MLRWLLLSSWALLRDHASLNGPCRQAASTGFLPTTASVPTGCVVLLFVVPSLPLCICSAVLFIVFKVKGSASDFELGPLMEALRAIRPCVASVAPREALASPSLSVSEV